MTTREAPVTLGDPTWVACSASEFGPVGERRHLVRLRVQDGKQIGFMLDTACGASASVDGIWRRNTTKPKCASCEKAAR